jgi:alkaline phosphatase
MHTLDYDRALGELLELDDTIKATLKHLEEIGELDETLVIVTADHGHGFDVTGGVDTKYMDAQSSDRKKRDAVGTYEQSGLSQYMAATRTLSTLPVSTSPSTGTLVTTCNLALPPSPTTARTTGSIRAACASRRSTSPASAVTITTSTTLML